jgi:ATP/ADP translocase
VRFFKRILEDPQQDQAKGPTLAQVNAKEQPCIFRVMRSSLTNRIFQSQPQNVQTVQEPRFSSRQKKKKKKLALLFSWSFATFLKAKHLLNLHLDLVFTNISPNAYS